MPKKKHADLTNQITKDDGTIIPRIDPNYVYINKGSITVHMKQGVTVTIPNDTVIDDFIDYIIGKSTTEIDVPSIAITTEPTAEID